MQSIQISLKVQNYANSYSLADTYITKVKKIDDLNNYELKIPNKEILDLYKSLILEWTKKIIQNSKYLNMISYLET